MSSTNPSNTHEQAHRRALKRDARNRYTVGDKLEVVLEQTPQQNNGRDGIARVNGLVVFVHPGNTSVTVGAHLEIRVTYVDENYIRGVALRRLDRE